MNTWPGGHRHAIHQSDHETWNARNYPGTRQICVKCESETGRCEEDSLYIDDQTPLREDQQHGPFCDDCYGSAIEALAEQSR